MKMFDYIFYKITKAYFKLDGRSGATGIAGVTIVQGLLLFDIFFFVLKLLKVDLPFYSKTITAIASIVILILFALNFYRYSERYNKLRFLWKNESESKSAMGWILVFFLIFFPIILLYLISNSL